MRRGRARALLASALCAWACAKQTGSDLGGSAVDSRAGKGGGTTTTSTGGTQAAGGSSGTAAFASGGTLTSGQGGTGTGGTSAGGSSNGGTATGGNGNTTSTGGSAGSSGDTSNGGQAGDDTIPPEVLANAEVVLRYVARGHADTANAVDTQLFFENKSSDPLPLSQVKVRYWTTLEGSWGNLACYFAAIGGSTNVTLSFVEDGDDSHVLIGFKSGEVPAHNSSPFKDTEFQMKVDAQGGGMFDQSNDWSFDGTAIDDGAPVPNGKITVYLAEKLIWGCEPSRKCAGDDGAGGQGGQAGEVGTGGTGGTGVGGSVSAGQGGEPSSGQGGA